jgi:hypothetical protein
MLLVDADCVFYDPAPTTILDEPTSVHVPPNNHEESIATLRQFCPGPTAPLTDLTETRPLIQTELTVKTLDGGPGPRFGGSGPCIVKVEQQLSFAFLDKWIYF